MKWKLPAEFKEATLRDGSIQRHDGEPRLYELTRFSNDRTLHVDTYIECCDCSLTHHYLYNVLKTPDGKWYLQARAYRVPRASLSPRRKKASRRRK